MRTATIHKRPVSPFAIVLAVLIGLALHLLQPIVAIARTVKRAHCHSRISYSSNRIHALQCRLVSIDTAMQEERALSSKRPERIKMLAAMKAAACEEIADHQKLIHAAKQELMP